MPPTKQHMKNNTSQKLSKNGGPGLLDILNKGPHEPFSYDYGTVRTYYLSDEIGDPADYIDWFHEMRNARDSDVIKININSPGGNLFTAINFLQVLSETNAHIIVSVEGACMSAATLIFLCADEWELTNNALFLIHNYSGGAIGKGNEMYSDIVNKKAWTEKIFRDSYTDFLTEKELEDLGNDKDLWLNTDQVMDRLKTRSKIREKKHNAAKAKIEKDAKKSIKKVIVEENL